MNLHRINLYMYRLPICIFLFFCAVSAIAQKKEIAAAKDMVKSGSNLEQAQKNMEKLLLDSTNRSNPKIWIVLFDAVKKQYEQNNEKLYLKQNVDTTKLFHLTRQLFVVASSLDSLESIPNKKGKVSLEHRQSHASYLNHIRPNLYNGGSWFVRNKKFEEAYSFFDQYIVCSALPLFKDYNYLKNDKHLPTAAYWAVYCGYKMKNPKATLHHSYEALKDTTHYDYMLQYLAETYKLEKDTVRYVQTLREGFRHQPKFPFFFPRLVEYYADRNQLDSAMQVVDSALAVDSLSEAYLMTKSSILLNQGKNEESISVAKQLIARNDTLWDAYLNAGLAYFNLAISLDKELQKNQKRHQEIVRYYQLALPYLEKYKEKCPQGQAKWALPLYTIYLNLNKGKEFDEINAIIKK